jgi:hypothetical protein
METTHTTWFDRSIWARRVILGLIVSVPFALLTIVTELR